MDIEELIRQNKHKFDMASLPSNSCDEFMLKYKKHRRRRRRNVFYVSGIVAAVIMLIINMLTVKLSNQENYESVEMVKAYYSLRLGDKLEEVEREIATSGKAISGEYNISFASFSNEVELPEEALYLSENRQKYYLTKIYDKKNRSLDKIKHSLTL